MRKQNIKKILSCLFVFAAACGGGSSSNERVEFSGTWAGDANVKINAGDNVCSFFGGTYPVEWTFNKLPDGSYQVLDHGSFISTLEIPAGENAGVIHFPSTNNYIPDAELDCHGWETVTVTKVDANTMEWDYVGVATCGDKSTCEYSGSAQLAK